MQILTWSLNDADESTTDKWFQIVSGQQAVAITDLRHLRLQLPYVSYTVDYLPLVALR